MSGLPIPARLGPGQPWLKVSPHLASPAWLPCDASADFAERVNDRLAALGKAKAATAITELETLSSELITPEELLLAIGRATAGLPTMTAHALRLSAQWAAIRYLWAFAAPDHPPEALMLHDDTNWVRHHQRSVFTEQLGVGAAALLLEHRVLDPLKAVRYAEADAVLEPLVTAGVLRWPSGRQRPDLFVIQWDPGGPVEPLFVIECKGNSKGRSETVNQFARRGVEQAVSVVGRALDTRHLAFGVTARGVTVKSFGVEVRRPATVLSRNATAGGSSSPLADNDGPPRGGEPPGGGGDGDDGAALEPAIVVDEEQGYALLDAVTAADEMRLLGYAGQHEVAQARYDRRPARQQRLDTQTRRVDGAAYEGMTVEFAAGQGGVELFFGVDQQVLAALMVDEEPERRGRLTERQAALRERASQRASTEPRELRQISRYWTPDVGDHARAAAADDGTILIVSNLG